MIEQYGLDPARLYILYKAAPQDDLVWEETGIVGMQRFIKRLYSLVDSHSTIGETFIQADNDSQIYHSTQQVIKSVRTIMDSTFKFNQAITALMKLVADIQRTKPDKTTKYCLNQTLHLLYPFIPSTSNTLLSRLHGFEVEPRFPVHTTTEHAQLKSTTIMVFSN